jgi:hypothetical protein
VSALQSNDLHELELLKQVEATPQLSNRVAASKLGVSVKLAHELLKGMVSRGLLHVRKANARRWEYFLTPRGIREKARLTLEFIEFSMVFYREARRRSASVCRALSESSVETVGLLGAGDLAEIVYLGIQEWGLVLTEVYDAEPGREPFMGVPVQPYGALADSKADAIVVSVYDKQHPMADDYVPEGVQVMDNMHWVFHAPAPDAGEER